MEKKKTVISLILVSSLAILVLGTYWLVTINGPDQGNGYGDKEYMIENAFPNLSFNQPVGLKDSDDGSGNLFVIELDGRVWRIGNESTTSMKELFLDISENITGTGEGGLLGFAFHPDFHVNGLFYVSYTLKPSGNTRISQFSMNETNPDIVNLSSEEIILDVVQPFSNHNGGDITFGPDDFLYISLG
ncbi:glucose sorbosone dehydrogenase, partial [Candidatus Bathyarchaeota archaeon]|nr:glucose sorbosone dehydrogenase [Candidatus Bathyarchaeota archaeon]